MVGAGVSIRCWCACVGSGVRAFMFASRLGCTMRQSYPFLPYINGATAAAGKSVSGTVDGLDKVDSGKQR